MAQDITNPDGADRPDMRKHSVLFNTASSLAVGAILGAAIFAGSRGVAQLFKEKAARLPFKELLKKEASTIGITAAAAGASSFGATVARNDTIDQTRPYVEKLEQQRDNLIALQTAGSAR